MGKIQLKKPKPYNWLAPGIAVKPLTKALPYYKSRKGVYYHRVRYATAHYKDGILTHVAISFWCGGHGFLGEKGSLFSNVDNVLCATCEGRAIGAGLDGSRLINGRFVMFSPNYTPLA